MRLELYFSDKLVLSDGEVKGLKTGLLEKIPTVIVHSSDSEV